MRTYRGSCQCNKVELPGPAAFGRLGRVATSVALRAVSAEERALDGLHDTWAPLEANAATRYL